MAMKSMPPPPPAKPKVKLRFFRDKESGVIHQADERWALIMANRTDLKEVPNPKGDTDESID